MSEPIVQFFLQSVEMAAESREQGRPIFRDIEHVRIIVPGDSKSVVVRKAREDDKARFKEQYEAFKRGDEQPVEGTPLKQWGRLTQARVMELKALNVHTVEQLRDLTDEQVQGIGMGGREERAEADAFLKSTKDNSHAQALAAANEQLEAKVQQQMATIEELSARIEALESNQHKRGPGRPRKEAA